HANLFAFAREHQRTQLEKPEIRRLVGALRQTDGELDLHRTAERVFADAIELVKNAGKGKHAVLQDGREAYNPRPAPTEPVIDSVVVHRVRGGEHLQGAVGFGDVEPEWNLAQISRRIIRVGRMVQVERPEFGLRISQNVFHRRKLHQMPRVSWAEAQTLPSPDHCAAESQGDGSEAVFHAHGRVRIEIARAHDSGKFRIKASAVFRTHYLLDKHGHLFLFQTIGRSAHVGFGMLAEGGGIDELDGLHELLQARLDAGILVGQHEGFVHAGEGLVLRVLQQAGGAHGQRIMHLLKERQQLVDEGDGQRRFEETSHDLGIIGTVNRQIKYVVLAEEAVEDFGGQHQRCRHADTNAVIAASNAALVQQVAYEGKATRLSAERTAADLEEEGFVRRERRHAEFADQDLALVAAILGNGFNQIAPEFLGISEVGNFAWPEFLRQGKFGARHQPV